MLRWIIGLFPFTKGLHAYQRARTWTGVCIATAAAEYVGSAVNMLINLPNATQVGRDHVSRSLRLFICVKRGRAKSD